MEVFWEKAEWAGSKLETGLSCLSWMRLTEEGQGLLASGSVSGAVGITRTDTRLSHPPPQPRKRLNFNLRGHRFPITKVAWNSPQSKLATCDDSGVIYVWVPYEERWSVELVNDRGVKVRDFAWSPNGSAALIAYEDNFVLIGSASGQRIWSNVFQESITAGVWSPSSAQVLLASSQGHLRLLTDNGAPVSETTLSKGVARLAWSCQRSSGASTMAVFHDDGELLLSSAIDDPDSHNISTGLTLQCLQWAGNGEWLMLGGEKDGWSGIIVVTWEGDILLRSEVGSQWGWTGPLTGIAWIGEEEAVVVALGERIATGRLIPGVPSLTALASRAVWRGTGERREAISDLPLPQRLRLQTAAHSGHIIQSRVPSQKELLDCVVKSAPYRSFCTILPEPRSPQTFILCMEHMGGLVPILKGRQTNKLLPEFEIRVYRHAERGEETSPEPSASTSSSPSQLRPAEREVFAPPPSLSRDTIWRRSKRKIADMVQKAGSFGTNQVASRDTEERLLVISSNMWCTRFKMSGLNPALLPDFLGQVLYKTSVLHLQPRQMTVQVVDLAGSSSQPLPPPPPEAQELELESDPEPSTTEAPPIAPMESEIFLDHPPPQNPPPQVEASARDEDALLSDVLVEFNELRTAVDAHIARMRQFASELSRSSAQLQAEPSPELLRLVQPPPQGGPFQRRRLHRPASQPPNQNQSRNANTSHNLLSSASVQSSPPISMEAGRGGGGGGGRLSALRSSFVGRFHRSQSDRLSLPQAFFQSLSRRRRHLNRRSPQMPLSNLLASEGSSPVPTPAAAAASTATAAPAIAASSSTSSNPGRSRERAVDAPAKSTEWEERLSSIGFIDEDEALLVTEEAERRRLRARALSCDQERLRASPRSSPTLASFRRAFRPSLRRGESKQLKEISSVLDKLYTLSNELKPKPVSERGPSTSSGGVEQRMGGGKVAPNGAGLRLASMAEEEGDELRVRVREIAARVSQLEARLSAGNELLEDVRADLESRVGRIRHVLGEEEAKDPLRLVSLQNKAPFWNEQSQVYQLDFGGRVTQESAKNFQVDLDDVQVMQFGRIEGGAYTLDFQAPFSPAQAFAVALASITQRLK